MFLWTVVGVILCLSAYNVTRLLVALKNGGELAQASSPFSAHPANAQHRMLVLGDSTAVGTGAASSLDSVAGRIAQQFPQLEVVNHAADGALTAALATQLRRSNQQTFDLVLIQVGGNDALRLSDLDEVRGEIEAAIGEALNRAERVVLLSTGDLLTAPALPWPINHLFSARAQSIREIFKTSAHNAGAQYVDLYSKDDEPDLFADAPEIYYARDGLHPSSQGYALWYKQIQKDLPLDDWFGVKP